MQLWAVSFIENHFQTLAHKKINYHPQRSWGKVMFLHVSVILFTGGVVSQHALQAVSQHALQQVSRGGIPACLAGFQVHTQGEVKGSGRGGGGSSGPHLGGVCSRGCLLWGGGVGVPAPGGYLLWGCVLWECLLWADCSKGWCGDPYCCGLLLQAVRILLECILVKMYVSTRN